MHSAHGGRTKRPFTSYTDISRLHRRVHTHGDGGGGDRTSDAEEKRTRCRRRFGSFFAAAFADAVLLWTTRKSFGQLLCFVNTCLFAAAQTH